MSIEIKVPVLPESVADATIVTWHKKPGDSVKRDENLVDIETDKVVLEVPAPEDGVLERIVKGDGETVSAQEVIAYLQAGAVASEKPVTAQTSTVAAASTGELSPSVRRIVAEHDVDPQQVVGTGKEGRITKPDVQRLLQQSAAPVSTSVTLSGERP